MVLISQRGAFSNYEDQDNPECSMEWRARVYAR
jgi:hypothetical protein